MKNRLIEYENLLALQHSILLIDRLKVNFFRDFTFNNKGRTDTCRFSKNRSLDGTNQK